MRPWEQARLTLRQKTAIYFHARDKEGHILIPPTEPRAVGEEKALTLEQELAALEQMAIVLAAMQKPLSLADLNARRDELRAKFAAKETRHGQASL